jgi:hypothetical protein
VAARESRPAELGIIVSVALWVRRDILPLFAGCLELGLKCLESPMDERIPRDDYPMASKKTSYPSLYQSVSPLE